MPPGGRRRALPPEEVEEIIREYAAGVRVRDILERHGIGASTLYRILSEAGVERRGRKTRGYVYRRVSREEAELAHRLRSMGLGVRTIARILGRPASTVYTILKRGQPDPGCRGSRDPAR